MRVLALAVLGLLLTAAPAAAQEFTPQQNERWIHINKVCRDYVTDKIEEAEQSGRINPRLHGLTQAEFDAQMRQYIRLEMTICLNDEIAKEPLLGPEYRFELEVTKKEPS